MLYRLAMIGIVAFWLVMMALLVRLETHPEETDILNVPVSYVMRIMFSTASNRCSPSRWQQDHRHRFTPAFDHGSNGRALDFSGSLEPVPPTV